MKMILCQARRNAKAVAAFVATYVVAFATSQGVALEYSAVAAVAAAAIVWAIPNRECADSASEGASASEDASAEAVDG